MKIKEFAALNLKECLQQVRNEMGPEAVILETSKFKTGGIMGWGAKDAVKIVAATGVAVESRESRVESRSSANAAERQAAGGKRQAAVATADVTDWTGKTDKTDRTDRTDRAERVERSAAAPSDNRIRQLERELSELRSGMNAIRAAVVSAPAAAAFSPLQPSPQPTETALYPELYAKLRDAEVSEEMALELLQSLPDLSGWNVAARAPLAESAVRDAMTGRVEASGAIQLQPGKTRVVALIGPTGVGKTTTIAKLAAHFALVEKKKVGLITMDTYRIAAVEQLKTYSQIIDIPIRVAHTQAEIGPALEAFAGFDLVLIDTAGRSQKNLMQVSELKSLVDTAGCETHLVLSASTKEKDLRDQIARFRSAQIDHLLFTKLDETVTYGTLFTIAATAGIPVSYLTTGQKVPEDIEAADASRLASLVMNG